MGFTDSVSVLFEKEVYEVDLSRGSYSIQEEGSPFALVNNAVKASTGKELSSEAYRQVSYVNDISFSNEQVLMERAVNGSLGESVTGYSYGLWRESYSVEAGTGTGTSVGMETGAGTYYYTGTGSVANLVSGSGTKGYAYGPGGMVTVYGQVSMESRTNTQAGFYGYNGEYTHGSLGLQYLRARYLKVETGTFMSRDTYAGRVRDILSQNRYTYAENNPVTFADPSGHKVTFGTTIGNMFGGGRNTGKNSGIGGIIGNVAQTVVDKVTSTVSTARNTTRNTFKRATGNKGAVVTNTADNIVAQATGGITSVLSGGSPSANGPSGVISFVESVAAQIEAIRCQAYENCKNIVQEVINNIGWNFVTIYAIHGTMYDPLPMEQQIANAEYIYNYLRARGWSLEAICGVLGNMHIESHYNPGTWQYLDDADYGFGIVQWSDAESRFLQWIKESLYNNYGIEELVTVVNEMATNSPKELMDLELTYFLQSCEGGYWTPTREYDCPAIVSFEEYVKNEGNYNVREMAMIFHGTYEKSPETDSYVKRENWAEGWYNHFTGVEDIRECYKKYKY